MGDPPPIGDRILNVMSFCVGDIVNKDTSSGNSASFTPSLYQLRCYLKYTMNPITKRLVWALNVILGDSIIKLPICLISPMTYMSQVRQI